VEERRFISAVTRVEEKRLQPLEVQSKGVTQRSTIMIRSILAVLAGLVVLTIASFAIEAAVNPLLMHIFPGAIPDAAALSRNFPARLWMLAYTTFSIGLGGYATGWIASRAKIWHAAIMGAIEMAFTLYVMLAAPFPEVRQSPRWGFVVGMILMVPAACLGAAIRVKQSARLTIAPVS
jgi:hypothetical protein